MLVCCEVELGEERPQERCLQLAKTWDVVLMEHPVDDMEFLSCVARPIELIDGPSDEPAIESAGLRQLNAILLGHASNGCHRGETHPAVR